jgi:NAD(P)-dependent dehydrogenase (short-subunit alcohol dehydrogenase family)
MHGKQVLITGATSGIGRATAEAFARRGAHVIISGRDPERGQQVVAEIIRSGGSAEFVAADLAQTDQVRALAAKAADADVLVNNAGIYPFGATAEIDEDTYDATFDVNVKGPFFLTASLAPRMAERGAGSVINVTTIAAETGMPGFSAYGASKAAATLLTKVWAAEYGPRGVRVNAVAPGPTRTPGTEPMSDALEQIAGALVPLARSANADEIAEAIVFLASDKASYLNGAVVPVDGGALAGFPS